MQFFGMGRCVLGDRVTFSNAFMALLSANVTMDHGNIVSCWCVVARHDTLCRDLSVCREILCHII